ncbi:MAG TPA: YceD family protein [Rhodocyclaceae bacterium]|nr:YceD family protein [Rhodocyclaceae bacterium]
MIDSAAFAREGGRLEGEVDLAGLRRLDDVLAERTGTLHYAVTGVAVDRELFLDLAVRGVLRLRCQRCLEPMEFPIDLNSRFLLVEAGQDWPDDELEEDRFDAIEANKAMDLWTLVEDDVLLALPIAPRHEDCAQLAAAPKHADALPFAALAGLKATRH